MSGERTYNAVTGMGCLTSTGIFPAFSDPSNQLMRKQLGLDPVAMVLRGSTLLSELVLREVERRGTQGLRSAPPSRHIAYNVSSVYTDGHGSASKFNARSAMAVPTLFHRKLLALHSGAMHGGTGGPTYVKTRSADRGEFTGGKLVTGAPRERMQATERAYHKRAGKAAALRPFPSMSATEQNAFI